ncbi:MAG: YihA family ribosome biogenesis GTP-binding protein [Alphaproteobacteria bacterium]|nr:YihA family ribosome biogenesis GTP-binding protein [Alphaproteobacteria bacterium]
MTLPWAKASFHRGAGQPDDFPPTPWPEVALVGRSNVGKSSLLNALVMQNNLARVAKTPGRTQAINFFLIDQRAMLVDLPGYGYAKAPPDVLKNWQQLCPAYLQQRDQLKLVLWLLDSRRGLMPTDDPVRDLYEDAAYKVLPVLTKMDQMKKPEQEGVLKHIAHQLSGPPFLPPVGVSADKGWGLKELRLACEKIIKGVSVSL